MFDNNVTWQNKLMMSINIEKAHWNVSDRKLFWHIENNFIQVWFPLNKCYIYKFSIVYLAFNYKLFIEIFWLS